MAYHCERTELADQLTVSIRTRAAVQDLAQVLGSAYDAIIDYLNEVGEAPTGAPFVAYYNMDMADLDLEIGMPVARQLPGRGNVQPSEIPAGMAATCLYVGPYGDIAPAYDELSRWVTEHGYEPAGPVYEHYLNDPGNTPPAELQTQIVFPLKPAA